MPFTFLAHQTLVIPAKWARPRWFDGTALCVGSMAPDLAYMVNNTRFQFPSHTLMTQLTWSLPIAVALTLVWRHVIAEPFGAVLPGVLGHEVRALARARRPLRSTAISALLGGLSHVFLDGFTHNGGWAVHRIEWLRRVWLIDGIARPMCIWLQYAGHVVLSIIGLVMLVVLIRRGRFTAWSEPPPSPEPARGRPRVMWPAIAVGSALGLYLAWRAYRDPSTAIIRAAWAGFAGLLIGAAIARLAPARPIAASR